MTQKITFTEPAELCHTMRRSPLYSLGMLKSCNKRQNCGENCRCDRCNEAKSILVTGYVGTKFLCIEGDDTVLLDTEILSDNMLEFPLNMPISSALKADEASERLKHQLDQMGFCGLDSKYTLYYAYRHTIKLPYTIQLLPRELANCVLLFTSHFTGQRNDHSLYSEYILERGIKPHNDFCYIEALLLKYDTEQDCLTNQETPLSLAHLLARQANRMEEATNQPTARSENRILINGIWRNASN